MKAKKQILFSGIQPSGNLHIGNYLGAVKHWIKLQEEAQHLCVFSIVDYHALTGNKTAQERRAQILVTASELLALGVDPKKSIFFVQSYVPEHTELAWIFNAVTPMSELERMTQYKDKAAHQVENVNAGLFNYPILQAADILLYHTTVVPVGQDQIQHVELARDIARWYNNRFGEYFAEPHHVLTAVPKVMSLSAPEKKMSKSHGLDSVIELADMPDVVVRKLRKAVTSTTGGGHALGVMNLINLLEHFSVEQHEKFLAAEKDGSIRYDNLKTVLSEQIIDYFTVFRKKRAYYMAHPAKVHSILMRGAKKASRIAQKTMKEVRKQIGVR